MFQTHLLFPWAHPFQHRRAVRLNCQRLIRRLPQAARWQVAEREEGLWLTLTWAHERAYRTWVASDTFRAWKGETHVSRPRIFVRQLAEAV